MQRRFHRKNRLNVEPFLRTDEIAAILGINRRMVQYLLASAMRKMKAVKYEPLPD